MSRHAGMVLALGSTFALGVGAPALAHGITERVSVGTRGVQGDSASDGQVVSADGRFVAFSSHASNLVPDDTNSRQDVFVRDRQKATTQRVSVGSEAVQSNGSSYVGAISADGRLVVFTSNATNLVPGGSGGGVFVRDLKTGTTQLVSVGPGGVHGNSTSTSGPISADGRFVAFMSFATNLVPGDTNDQLDVFVHDRQTHTTERVSVGLGGVQARNGNGQS